MLSIRKPGFDIVQRATMHAHRVVFYGRLRTRQRVWAADREPKPGILQHLNERVLIVPSQHASGMQAEVIEDRKSTLSCYFLGCPWLDLYSLDALRDFGRLLDVDV